MISHKNSVHIPAGITPYPEQHEITAADILTAHFEADVYFIAPTSYKTADFKINGFMWELKSPTGKGKRNIQRTLQTALIQAQNIIFDARRSKIHQNKIKHELQFQFTKARKIKRLILITKTGRIIEFRK